MTTLAEHANILTVVPTLPEPDTGTDLVYVFGKQQYHSILAQILSFYENKCHNHDPMGIQGLGGPVSDLGLEFWRTYLIISGFIESESQYFLEQSPFSLLYSCSLLSRPLREASHAMAK